MSYVLSKQLCYTYSSIDQIRHKKIAVDISSIIYTALYKYSFKQGFLKNSEGSITSHIYGVLQFLVELNKYDLKPYICFDSTSPEIKKEVVNKRRADKKKYCQAYLKNLSLRSVSNREAQRYNLASADISKMYGDILDLVKMCGIPYAIEFGQEAEKLCATLYKNGIVDCIFSPDRDVTLYNCDTIVEMNFKNNTLKRTALDQTIYKLGVDYDTYLVCAIAAGNDYTKGIPDYGPKRTINFCKSNCAQQLKALCLKNNVDVDFIINYFIEKLDMAFLNRQQFSLNNLLDYLTKLDFSKPFISKVSLMLMNNSKASNLNLKII